MNIIANDCAGAYIYRDSLKSEFLNPFIWSSIDIENFIKLIREYETIDFRNITCELILNESGICKQQSYIPVITIDNQIDVHYFHYIQYDKYKIPTKVSGYTMYDDIIGYTKEHYMKRLQEMTEQPLFIWDVTACKWYNRINSDPVSLFKTIQTNYKIIIYSTDVETGTDRNIITARKPTIRQEVNTSAYDIYKRVIKDL